MGEVRSQVGEKRCLKKRRGRTLWIQLFFRIEPGTTEGLHYAHVSYWFCRPGNNRRYILSSLPAPSLLLSSVCSKEPWLASGHLCSLCLALLVVSKHIRSTLTEQAEHTDWQLVHMFPQDTQAAFDHHKLFVYTSSASVWIIFLSILLCKFTQWLGNVIRSSLEIVINRSF